MNNHIIISHHGSPGSPRDFDQLKEHLSSLSSLQLLCLNRYGDTDQHLFREKNNSIVQMGYSFGAVQALKDAAQNPKITRALILIAPYLYPNKTPGALTKLILHTPLMGKKILASKAKMAIDEMLITSSHPHQVPSFYREQAPYFMRTNILKASVLEKNIDKNNIEKWLAKCQSHNIPLYLIYGDSDKSSASQFEKLKASSKMKKEFPLPKAGHALPYTHPKEVALKISQILDDLTSTTQQG